MSPLCPGAQLTILTNICLIEDLESSGVVVQHRSPETNHRSGYASRRSCCGKRRLFESQLLSAHEDQSEIPKSLSGIKKIAFRFVNAILFLGYKATEFTTPVLQKKEKWIQKYLRFQIWSGLWYITFDGDDGSSRQSLTLFSSSSYRRFMERRLSNLLLNNLVDPRPLDIVEVLFAFCLNQWDSIC